ncbi:stage II sporulation protein M [Bacillus cereus]|uniref:stage II sporulation protein M n=1 Tax=Bacillus cereus TaxID=1396 RepID=UPI002405EE45|nr:stage II sporulation protein M [Bacillus cereus]MDF9623669.1 stage II sporulation protein M [Bacillus cereus]
MSNTKKFLLLVVIYILFVSGLLFFDFKDGSFDLSQKKDFSEILSNNVMVTLNIILFGILSFGVISLVLIIFNAIILATTIKLGFARWGLSVFVGLLPHGVFEISANLLALVIVWNVNNLIVCKLINKRYIDYRSILSNNLNLFCGMIFLLFIGAWIESGVSHMLIMRLTQ